MTEKLKTLLHERATEPDFATPDLDALVRDGDRRIRRRRGGAAAGSVAVVVVVGALLVPQLTGSDDASDGPRIAQDPGSALPVTWATGSVIHDGDHPIDVGFEVNAFVRTTAGFVFADPHGYVYSVVGGQVSDIGQVDAKQPRLVSDDGSTLAGWVDSTGDRPAFVVFDQSDGSVTRHDDETTPGTGALAAEDNPTDFYAIDDGTAYWRDTRGAVAVGLVSGDVRVIDPEARNGFDIMDAENGVIAFNAGDEGTALGTSRADAVMLPQVYGNLGVFSPDAAYYSSDADEPQVYDARTGKRVALDLNYWFGTGYTWLDDRTLALIAQDTKKSPVQLLTCVVPAGTCDVTVPDLGSFDDLAASGFALPVGEHIGD